MDIKSLEIELKELGFVLVDFTDVPFLTIVDEKTFQTYPESYVARIEKKTADYFIEEFDFELLPQIKQDKIKQLLEDYKKSNQSEETDNA